MFLFKQKTAYEMRISDWSSDVCSSDLAGKTLADAVAEVREAVDFLRYYAAHARADFPHPITLPVPTGERNELILEGKGLFVCISPWNFPLAIFLGQVSAALAAGNAVLAKPAEQTPLIAHAAVQVLLEAGVPGDVLALLPGRGETVGAALTGHDDIIGVAFTGSTEVARAINRGLAGRDGPIRSEEHTSELQSLIRISYAGFCLNNNTVANTSRH